MPTGNLAAGRRSQVPASPARRGEDNAPFGGVPGLARSEARQLVAVLELLLDQFWAGEHHVTDPLEIACRLRAVRRRIDLTQPWCLSAWLEVRRRLLEVIVDLGDAHTVLELPRTRTACGVTALASGTADENAAIWRLPIDLAEQGGSIVVERACSCRRGIPSRGSRLLLWHGRPVEEVLDDLVRHVPEALGHPKARREALRWLTRRPLLRLPDLPARAVELLFEGADGSVDRCRLNWAGAGADPCRCRGAGSASASADEDEAGELRHWRVETLGPLRWLRLASIPTLDEVARIESCLAQEDLRAPVVVDLRGNRGGELASVEELLRLLSGDPTASIGVTLVATAVALRLGGDGTRGPGWGAAPTGCRSSSATTPPDVPPGCFVLVDAATFSAAEVLAGALRLAGARVIGVDETTGGGTENTWSYDTLRRLLPNRRSRLRRSQSKCVIEEEAGRRGARVVRLNERRWWIGAGGTSSGCSVEVADTAESTAQATDPWVELLWYERDAPVLPDLPPGVGLQLPVRRTEVWVHGSSTPARDAVGIDLRLPRSLRGAPPEQIAHWLMQQPGRRTRDRTGRHAWCLPLEATARDARQIAAVAG